MAHREWKLRLEEQKARVLETVCGWPAELREWRPADGGWNALEVLDHVARVDAGIVAAVSKRLDEPPPMGVRDRIGFVFVERVLLSRRRVKMPGAVRKLVSPGEELELGEITARWERARLELDRLDGHSGGAPGGVFRHPVSGWMNFQQVLRLIFAHTAHHGYQLERIRDRIATSRLR